MASAPSTMLDKSGESRQLVLSLIMGERLLFFPFEYNAYCGLMVNSFDYVEENFFSSHLIELLIMNEC